VRYNHRSSRFPHEASPDPIAGTVTAQYRKYNTVTTSLSADRGGKGGFGQSICRASAKEGVLIAVVYAQGRGQVEGVASELASSYRTNANGFVNRPQARSAGRCPPRRRNRARRRHRVW
jgi:hypothetical protein